MARVACIITAVVPCGSALAAVVLMVPGLVPAAQGPGLPDLDTAALASGPYSHMRMLLERTIFGFDVLTVDVRVDERTRRDLERAVRVVTGVDRLADEVAAVVVEAEQVLVTLEFRRRVAFTLWLREVRDSLRKARDAGLIEEQTFRSVSASLPEWFRPLVDRGFERGDQIVYRGYQDRMRTLVASARGEVLVDRVDTGATPRRAMLAGYFAPGTEFREPLAASLLAH